MRATGEIVIVHTPRTADEDESWTLGPIVKTLASGPGHALHVVAPTHFRWDGEDWQKYDGVPGEIARETAGRAQLEFVDTWPRRRR